MFKLRRLFFGPDRRRKSGIDPTGPIGDPGGGAGEPWVEAFHPPEWVRRADSLWPGIRKRMETEIRAAAPPPVPSPRKRPNYRWAVAAAGLFGCALLFFLYREAVRPADFRRPGSEGSRVTILSAEIEGREAGSSIFQTTSASFIWFYPTPVEGGQR